MIDYLNLEISEPQKRKITLDQNSLVCYFLLRKHNHILHSEENPQANSIVNLIISQAEDIKLENNKHNHLLNQLLEYFQKNFMKTIRQNLDYITSQLEDNNKNIQRIPSKRELSEQVELRSLEIVEQLKLEVQKIQLVQKELSEQVDKLHNKIDKLLV